MPRDRLFTLRPGYMDGGRGPFYCPGSLKLEGLLSYFPQLRYALDVQYIEFPRPRKVLVDLIGEENQGAPVLVLGRPAPARADRSAIRQHGATEFVNGSDNILAYLSAAYGIPADHHQNQK
jgi:hypothetical protein